MATAVGGSKEGENWAPTGQSTERGHAATACPGTVFFHCCDILSWALVSSNQCRSTGLYGAINAGREPRSSSSTRKTGATWAELWIEWLPQRVPKNGERLHGHEKQQLVRSHFASKRGTKSHSASRTYCGVHLLKKPGCMAPERLGKMGSSRGIRYSINAEVYLRPLHCYQSPHFVCPGTLRSCAPWRLNG